MILSGLNCHNKLARAQNSQKRDNFGMALLLTYNPPCTNVALDRRAKVLFRGTRSRSLRIGRGVLQGSVLGPALFILYVDDLAKTLSQGTKQSLYADDLAIWSSFLDPLKVAHTVQKALDHVEEWSLKWRFPFNPDKCECCFFRTDCHQASHQPQLTLTGTPHYIQLRLQFPRCYF